MIQGIVKKLILTSFLFIDFIQPLKSSDIQNFNNSSSILNFSKISNNKNFSNYSNQLLNSFWKNSNDKNLLDKYFEPLIADINEKPREIVIQSDQQSEDNGVIYATGNVLVEYLGKILKADNLIYDKTIKKISAQGNIALVIGDQIFKSSKLEYSFIDKRGYLLDVKGSVDSNTLIEDLSSNFSSLDSNRIESLLELKKKEVLNTPGKVDKWLFFADKITIDGEKWKSKKAVFSNDLLEAKQIKIVINSLEVVPEQEKLRFKSSINSLIFDEKVSIPFWVGDRTLRRAGRLTNFNNRWNIGYENLDKDGYFIGRKFNPIDISDNFVLDLEPQFLIQRSLKGYTKSFVKEGDSITSERIKRNASVKDYFALKSQIKGRINTWDLNIENNLNSLDIDKFSDAFRSKTNLSKEINFFNSKWEKSFFGIYRDRVWNGSLGEAEIYLGYGSKLKKENNWVVNGIE